jgi:hypothetical protein
MWSKEYMAVLGNLAAGDELPVTVDKEMMEGLRRVLGWREQADGSLVNYEEEWQGMPEFESEDLTPVKTILVHFCNLNDLKEFADITGNTITEKTKFIWFPQKARLDLINMVAHES